MIVTAIGRPEIGRRWRLSHMRVGHDPGQDDIDLRRGEPVKFPQYRPQQDAPVFVKKVG